jgi:hypothetical protein
MRDNGEVMGETNGKVCRVVVGGGGGYASRNYMRYVGLTVSDASQLSDFERRGNPNSAKLFCLFSFI